jgi:Xaa-Pro aminopeptidase
MFTDRKEKVFENMKRHNLSQMIITSTPNIYYLTGAWIDPGERLLALYINLNGKTVFVLNELFKNNSRVDGLDVITYSDSDNPVEILSKIIDKQEVLGVDKNWPAHFLLGLMEKENHIRFSNASFIIDEIRMVKDKKEIEALKESSLIADKVMFELTEYIGTDRTEKQMSKLISGLFEKHGVDELSFKTIVSYGKNGADPHHITDNSLLQSGDSIVIDMGGVFNRYCSDITRTFFFGSPCHEARIIYDIVLQANLNAISIIRPGVTLRQIDSAARDFITSAGYGKYFTHRTGHNIGIEDHEYPSVSSSEEMPIVPNMVFSIEPGIYIPGKCGVRIEDLMVVTQNGAEVLNHYPKELRCL